jgi:hypothetical protein
MVHTIVDGAFRQTNLANESSKYLAKREELRLAEIASPRRAAIFPRALRFRTMRFKSAPATYHLMYGKRQSKPCPMCTAWLEGVNDVARSESRLRQRSAAL